MESRADRGCTVGSEADILPDTHGTESHQILEELETDGSAEGISPGKGEALVMGPGTRHRVMGYLTFNT